MNRLSRVFKYSFGLWLVLGSVAAHAALITAAPAGATVVDFSQYASHEYIGVGPTDVGSLAGESILWSASPAGIMSARQSAFQTNGSWYDLTNGYAASASGLGANVTMTLQFNAGPVAQVGAFMNYCSGTTTIDCSGSLYIQALDICGNVLESQDIASLAPIVTPGQANAGGFRGISRTRNDIYALRISSSRFFAIDNLSFLRATANSFEFVPGHLYTTAPFTNKVEHYGACGSYIDSLTLPGNASDERGLAFGPDGLLYVVTSSSTNSGGFDLIAIDSSAAVHARYPGTAYVWGNLSSGDIKFGADGKVFLDGGDSLFSLAPGVSQFQNIYTTNQMFATKPLPSGNLLALSAYDLKELAPDGSVLRAITTSTSLTDARGVEYDPVTNSIYVSMLGHSGFFFQVMRFDGKNGQLLASTGFNYADKMILTPDRHLVVGSRTYPPVVLDTDLNTIGVFNNDPQMFVAQFPRRFGPRILDTRTGFASSDRHFGQLAAGQTLDVAVSGHGGVATSGVSAVALNITATNPTASGYVTVSPSGSPRPDTSNLNLRTGATASNLVVSGLGADGGVNVFNALGSIDVVADVAWSFSAAAQVTPISPARLLDTRAGFHTIDENFAGGGALTAHQRLDLPVTGRGPVPSSGVGMVFMNVTATNPTAAGYLTVWPADGAQPATSNLNFALGDTMPNLVLSRVDAAGKVSLYNSAGTTDVVVDVAAWIPSTSNITPVSPARILDTRAAATTVDGQFSGTGPLAAQTSMDLVVAGRGGIPASGVGAVILNVTVTAPSAAGYITAWQTGSLMPWASNLNFAPGQTVANLVISKLGNNGSVSLYNSAGSSDLVVDVVGWLPIEP